MLKKIVSIVSRANKWVVQHKIPIILLGLLIILAAAGAFLLVPTRNDQEINAPVVQMRSPEQSRKAVIAQSKTNTPVASASASEKSSYYQNLITAYVDSNDYQGAIDTLLEQEKNAPDTMTYSSYYYLSYYQIQMLNKDGATTAASKAESKIDSESERNDSTIKTDLRNKVAGLRQEIVKL